MSDLISRKGVFIPGITVEMLRNAPLEGVEDLLASGEMEDISLPSAQPEIVRCKECKYFAGEGMYCVQDIIVQYDHFYCYHAERREEP